MNWEFMLTLSNLVIYLATALVIVMLIVRTEKKLDLSFKIMIIAPLILAVAAVFQLDRIFGIVPIEFSQKAFYISRIIANLAMFIGFLLMLSAISSNKKE